MKRSAVKIKINILCNFNKAILQIQLYYQIVPSLFRLFKYIIKQQTCFKSNFDL